MVMVEHMFRYRRFVWMSKPYMPEVIFYSGLCRSTSLSDVHLTTLTGYDVYPRSPQAQVVDNGTQESGDLPRRQSDTFNVAFGQHSAELAVCRLDIWKKNDLGGLVCRLGGSNRRAEGTTYLFDTTIIFPESGLEELQLIMEVFLVTQRPG